MAKRQSGKSPHRVGDTREFTRRVRPDEIVRVDTPCGPMDVQVRKRGGHFTLHLLGLLPAWRVTLPPRKKFRNNFK